MHPNDQRQQAQAEFYLCLARAFLTPDREEAWVAMRDDLADDLEDLDSLLGYGISGEIEGYRTALAAIPDQPALLQIYSGLFLAPPRRVSINSGTYLDGSVNGGSVMAMEEAYRQGGLERNEAFMDLADHVSIQLEFVGYSFASAPEAARGFLGRFVACWLPAFLADLGRKGCHPSPYLPLARALSRAVGHDARSGSAEVQTQLQSALGRARHARAVSGVTEEDMAFIARRLREKGLATEHLHIPLDQRDEAQGLSKKVPPSPRRGSRLG